MLSFLAHGDIPHLLETYGYGAVAGITALESAGLPVPGETALVAAAIVAGSGHTLNIWLVVAAAAAGAILGDNLGFLIGRRIGYWLLLNYGPHLRITESHIKIGQYLFMRHGGKVVFFGRFVAILRALAALLAGTNRMAWPSFLAFNAAGGTTWAMLYGFAAYYFGKALSTFAGPLSIAVAVVAVVGFIISIFVIRRHHKQLEQRAEKVLPGPLPRPRHQQ